LTGVVCKQGGTREGAAAVTLKRDGTILVCKKVSADVCEVFGEEYVDEHFDVHTTARLLVAAEENTLAGVQVDIREYIAA
jgi:YgiT-type zinc finger domain-containing protein